MKLNGIPPGDYNCPVCGEEVWFTLEDFEYWCTIAKCDKNHYFTMPNEELVRFANTNDGEWINFFMDTWAWAEEQQKKLEEKNGHSKDSQ